MDGFHRDNDDLRAHGLLARKGAPETFDVQGFEQVLNEIHAVDGTSYPTFDRSQDATVPGGGRIAAGDRTVLVEGNYLLLNTGHWGKLHRFWDLSVYLDVPLETLEQRLIQRWLDHGHTQSEAETRARGNDLINARLVTDSSAQADLRVTLT